MTKNVTTNQLNKEKGNTGNKYLTFSLGNEEYGIGILHVKEIIGLMKITTIPNTPEYVEGVINLRDKVIPVISLRQRFHMETIDYSDRTCIIVVEAGTVNMNKCWEKKQCGKQDCPAHQNSDSRCWMISGTYCRDEIQGSYHDKKEACQKCDYYLETMKKRAVLSMGIVVDGVSEVAYITDDNIEDSQALGSSIHADFIQGIVKLDGKVKILLDIERILNTDEKGILEEAA